jgi:hypothetical protein
LPIVQSGVTKRVSVANLTAGRSVSASQLNVDAGASVALVGIFNSFSVNGAYLQGRSSGNIIWDIGTTKNLFSGGTATDFGLTSRGGTLVLGTGSTPRLTLNSSGDATIANGNLVIGTSGKGIDFSATPGTGTSELFNDYEEGIWTPVDGSGAGLTFATAEGHYTKIGRLVTLYFTVEYPSTADASAGRIGGLPFTVLVDALSPSGGSFSVNTSAVALSVPATLQGTALALASNPATGGSLTNLQLSAAYLRGFVSYMV